MSVLNNEQIQKDLLNLLIDKYEKKLSGNDTDSNFKVEIKTERNSYFNQYFISFNDEYCDNIYEAFKILKNYQYINYIFENGYVLKYSLNLNKINDIYEFLSRENPLKRTKTILNSIKELQKNYSMSSTIYNFLNFIIQSLNLYKNTYLIYFKDVDELMVLIKLIDVIENNKVPVSLRNLSKKEFKDSKLIENNSSRILNIFNQFSSNIYDDFNELLKFHDIERNDEYIYIKGNLVIEINKTKIDLSKLPYGISFSVKNLSFLKIKKIKCKKILTIENLTTFHSFNKQEFISIYTGGYPSKELLNFIRIFKNFKNINFYHFGDIDWGGFQIFNNLKENLNVDLNPLFMDTETLMKYRDECLNLTANDRKNLNLLLEDEKYSIFNVIIKQMLKENIKLEQESIEF